MQTIPRRQSEENKASSRMRPSSAKVLSETQRSTAPSVRPFSATPSGVQTHHAQHPMSRPSSARSAAGGSQRTKSPPPALSSLAFAGSPSRPTSPISSRKSLAQRDPCDSFGWKFLVSTRQSKQRTCECGMVRPTYGPSSDGDLSSALWCVMCPNKPPGAFYLDSSRCLCGKSTPRYAVILADGKLDIRWCALCPTRPKDAVNAKAAIVKRAGGREPEKSRKQRHRTKTHAEGADELLFCSICAPPEAVVVADKLCLCGTHRPTHAMPGEDLSDAKWCATCPSKPSRAVDVVSNKCVCKRGFPRFGMPGAKPVIASSPSFFGTLAAEP